MPHEKAHWSEIESRRQDIRDLHAEYVRRSGWISQKTDAIGRMMARPGFFLVFLLIHVAWLVLNLPFMPWEPWDPYPFVFMATVASVEAPFVALLILMHQDQDRRADELTNETNLLFTLHMERQLSASLRLIRAVQEKMEIEPNVRPELLDHLQEEMQGRPVVEALIEDMEAREGHM